MSRLTSISPSSKIEEMRDGQAFPVTFFTGLGRNGTREYRLSRQDRFPIDLTGMDLKVVVKTAPGQAPTELDPNFPLTATITNAGDGRFTVDYAAVDFLVTQTRVLVVLYDDSGANPVVLAQSTTVILKAGV